MAGTTRAGLRSSLQRKTDNQLTVAADQDIYLNIADKLVQSDWSQFDPTILRTDRDTGTTDANGILSLDEFTIELERVEDADKTKYPRILIHQRWESTGYYFVGLGSSNTVRRLQIMLNGSVAATKVMYWWALKISAMAADAASEPVIPEEFRELIAMRAAALWYLEQGSPMMGVAEKWTGFYEEFLNRARRAYRQIDTEPEFAPSYDPDAGGMGSNVIHRTT